MKPGERIYNKVTDKEWSSDVYHKAKEAIEKVLSPTKDVIQFDSICEATRQQHPSLCDDNVKDPRHHQRPYWKHIVASAIQALKKQGKVIRADNGWGWVGAEPLPPPPPTDGPDELARRLTDLLKNLVELAKQGRKEAPPTHDEAVQKVKEIGEMLGRIAEVKWGPKFEYDCVWKDNVYANPRFVIEVCDKGNLYKDLTSLDWAAGTWGAKGIWVIFDDADFHKAKEMLAQKSQIYPLKAEDMLKLHSLLQAGNTQAIKSIFTV